MRPKLLLVLLLLALSASSSETPKDLIYSGVYSYNFEMAGFSPDGLNEGASWCPSGDLSETEDERGPSLFGGGMKLKVRGTLGPEGHFGSFSGPCTRMLEVLEVLSVTERYGRWPEQ